MSILFSFNSKCLFPIFQLAVKVFVSLSWFTFQFHERKKNTSSATKILPENKIVYFWIAYNILACLHLLVYNRGIIMLTHGLIT